MFKQELLIAAKDARDTACRDDTSEQISTYLNAVTGAFLDETIASPQASPHDAAKAAIEATRTRCPLHPCIDLDSDVYRSVGTAVNELVLTSMQQANSVHAVLLTLIEPLLVGVADWDVPSRQCALAILQPSPRILQECRDGNTSQAFDVYRTAATQALGLHVSIFFIAVKMSNVT